MVKKKSMSLGVKKRTTKGDEIDDSQVDAFAAQAETERNKATQRKGTAKKTAKKLSTRAVSKKKVVKKVVRDSFTMPENDYEQIAELKTACLKLGVLMNKGEILRAGLNALTQMSDEQLKKTALGVEKVQTGRPKQ